MAILCRVSQNDNSTKIIGAQFKKNTLLQSKKDHVATFTRKKASKWTEKTLHGGWDSHRFDI